jgi:EamA domain-containing membrane protein RarD
VMFRAEIELIDAMIVLNSSTTRLMWVAIGVAIVGVLMSAAQIVAAGLLRR